MPAQDAFPRHFLPPFQVLLMVPQVSEQIKNKILFRTLEPARPNGGLLKPQQFDGFAYFPCFMKIVLAFPFFMD